MRGDEVLEIESDLLTIIQSGTLPKMPDGEGIPLAECHAAFAVRCSAEDLVHRAELQIARRGYQRGAAGGAGEFHEACVMHVPAREARSCCLRWRFRTTSMQRANWA